MKKFLILALLVLVGVSLVSVCFADSSRTITRKTVAVTAGNTVAVAHSATLYRVSGYASSASAIFAIVDTATNTGNFASTSAVKVEGGEATQYDSITPMTFGDEGLEFYTGITVAANGCSLVLEYI